MVIKVLGLVNGRKRKTLRIDLNLSLEKWECSELLCSELVVDGDQDDDISKNLGASSTGILITRSLQVCFVLVAL